MIRRIVLVPTLLVASTAGASRSPPRRPRVPERRHVPQPDIQRLEVRRFSWLKSGLGAAVLGAVAYVLYDILQPSVEPW